MENSIEKSLLEVRKAYRLLFDYQSRILDLMSFIERKIEYNFESGWSLYSDASPKDGKGSLESWSWDWLNMYYYHFYFGEIKKEGKLIRFGIAHMADSGFFESNEEHKDKLHLKKYEAVENSKSKLIFVIGSDMWNWGEKWNAKDFTTAQEGHKPGTQGGQMIFKSYSLESFASEDSATKNLKDFEEYCEKYKIPFTINTRKIEN